MPVEFNARSATTSFQTANIPVQIKGRGMFDFLHGQTGVAPNGIELHPVLGVYFQPRHADPGFRFDRSANHGVRGAGGSKTTTVSTTVSGGFNSAVSLSATGLPAGVTASFSPTSIAAPGSGSFHPDVKRQQHGYDRHVNRNDQCQRRRHFSQHNGFFDRFCHSDCLTLR